jgi:hypothetical protein
VKVVIRMNLPEGVRYLASGGVPTQVLRFATLFEKKADALRVLDQMGEHRCACEMIAVNTSDPNHWIEEGEVLG